MQRKPVSTPKRVLSFTPKTADPRATMTIEQFSTVDKVRILGNAINVSPMIASEGAREALLVLVRAILHDVDQQGAA